MNFKKILLGGAVSFALISLSACDDGLKDSEKEANVKLSVEFESAEFSVPIDGVADLFVKVTPVERASEVEFVVADESVITIGFKEDVEDGVKLSLASHKLSTTTVYAVFDDAEKTPECKVTVAPIALEGIVLDRTEAELKVYETVTLSAKLSPDNVTSPSLTWKTDNAEVATVDNGLVTALKAGTAVVTVSCQGKDASCTIKVSAIPAESVSLYFDKEPVSEKEITEGESFRIDAVILPETATYQTISSWTVSNAEVLGCEAIYIGDNTVSAYVTGKAAGTSEIIATIDAGDGTQPIVAKCSVTVNPLVPPVVAPKIGDYYYSDGTWSDGGLISIDSNGKNAQWADAKPAPVEGKTVIGIVFQTDPARFSDDENNAGYNHGLVFCLKSAHGDKSTETRYAFDDERIDFLGGRKYGSSWYGDLSGYTTNKRVLSNFVGELNQVPAFDFVHTDFSPAAPANTSGWFIPSIGQLWDFVVNLGGIGVAEKLETCRTYEYDITYFKERADYQYGQFYVGYNVMDVLNAHWAKVKENQKDNLVPHNFSSIGNTCWLLSCTSYQSGEACCVIELGDNDCIYLTPEYFSNEFCCHPILAF